MLSALAGTLLWWWTARLMLRGEVRWRPLLPTAVITGLGTSIYAMAADVWMPVTVTGNFAQFGAFGIALSFVTFFTGLAFVIVIGAVIGPVLAGGRRPGRSVVARPRGHTAGIHRPTTAARTRPARPVGRRDRPRRPRVGIDPPAPDVTPG